MLFEYATRVTPSTSPLTSLLSGLTPIRDKAKGLYDRITAEGYVETEDDIAAVSVLAEELRDVLFEYWVGTNPGKLI
jgi:hypothetical protein